MSRKNSSKKNEKNALPLQRNAQKKDGYYRILAENSRDIIATHDMHGKIIYINPAWEKITGYSVEETLGKSITNFIPSRNSAELEKHHAQKKAGDKNIYTYEIEILGKNGEKIPLELSSTPISANEAEYEEILIIARDLRERKKVEETLIQSGDSYRDLLNSIDDAIYIQDKEGRFLDANRGAEKLYGIPREEFIGKTPDFLAAPKKNDMADIRRKIQIAFEGKPQEFEFWGKRKNGDFFLKEVHIYKGNYFGEEVIIALAKEITKRKESEVALKRQLNELNILQATAFTSSHATEEKFLIRQVTNIIGNTFYPDNFGILLFDKARNKLQPHHSYHGISDEAKYSLLSLSKGITGKVASTGKALRIANVSQSPEYEMFTASTRSELCVPIKTGEKILGVINAESSKKDFFTKDDERLLNTIAGQMATSIEKMRFFQAEQKGREEAETLRETALAVTASLNLKEAVQHILEQLARVLPYDSASIQILEKTQLRIFSGHGWQNPDDVEGIPFSLDGSTPNTRVILKKKVLILDDAPAQYPLFNLPPHNHIISWMGVPLIIRNKVIGMLSVDSREKSYFTEENANLAQAFANQAAIAIENARLFNAEQARRQEAETLRQSAHTISSSLNLDEVLETILASIKRAIPYDSAAIMLIEKNILRITCAYGLPNIETQIEKTFSTTDPLLEKLVENAHPLILANAQESPYFKKWAGTDYVRGWMGVPLIVRGSVIGYITLDSRKVDAFQERDAELAQTFAHQAASAIENAHLYQEALRATERRAVLHRLSQDILRGIQSPEKTYAAIHHAAKELMGCDAFLISLRDKDSEVDNAVYLIDLEKQYSAREIPRENSIVTFVEKLKGSFIQTDLATGDLQIQEERFGSQEKVRSILVSPMSVGEKLIGAISAQSYSPHAYDEEEKVLLEMLASHAAAAIENARLYSETVQRGIFFAELYKTTQDLIAPKKLEVLLKTTLERATNLLGISSGGIYLCDSEREELEAIICYGLSKKYEEKIKGIYIQKGEGAAGRVAETREALLINDYRSWKGKSQQYENVPFTSVLEVPMLYAGNLIGVLALYELFPKTHIFTENDERNITLFATQIAGAVHSAKQFEQINHRLSELEAVNRTSIALRSAETPKEMLSVLLNELSSSLDIEVCSIWLDDSNTKELIREAACGWIKNIPPDHQPADVGLIGHIFQSGESYTTPNFKNNPYVQLAEGYELPDDWTGAWVPIRSTDKIIGVIAIIDKFPRKFSKEDIRLLTTLAEIFGNAIHRARLHERAEKQVKRLTTLRNIDAAISTNFELHITLRLLVDHTIAQLGVDAANILLVTPSNQNLKYFVGNGFKTTLFSSTDLPRGGGLPGEASRTRVIQSSKSPYDENCRRKSWFAEEDFIRYYCVPLIAKGKTLGVLEIYHRENTIHPQEWHDFLQALAGQAAIAIDNNYLFKDLDNSHKELALAYDTTLEGWGKALELRDKETQGHTLNVTDLTLRLAREMNIPDDELVHIYRGALLHDIGKMGIPDNILRKPGPLTKDEWKIMRQHPQFAYEMLSPISYLLPALDIPYCHHERWDGKGYPRGLKHEEIPLAARIFSIIDVWDALLANRPYRAAWKKETIIDYLRNESETRFDPEIVEIFLNMIEKEE